MNIITSFLFNMAGSVAHAQNFGGTTGASLTVRDIVNIVLKFVNTKIMPLLVALGVIYFIINITYYIYNMGNEAKRTEFRKYTLNSILALFVMLSVWGIVGIGMGIIFPGRAVVVPQLPTSDNGRTGAP